MAKAILEYNLNDLDDKMAYMCAAKSTDMASFIFQLSYNTKKELERHLEAREFRGEKDLNEYEVLEMVFDKVRELIDEYGIVIDDLTR